MGEDGLTSDERLVMIVASHLGMSLTRCKREHTYSQLVKWLKFIEDQHANGFHRYDEYAARIWCELRALRIPKRSWNWKDFLLKFIFKKNEPARRKLQDPSITKAYLHAAMGITDDRRQEMVNGTRATDTSGGSGRR